MRRRPQPQAVAVASRWAPLPREYWWSFGLLIKAVVALAILMAGVLTGLAACANNVSPRYYYYSSLQVATDHRNNNNATTCGGGGGNKLPLGGLEFRGFVDPGPPWGHSMSDPELFWRASMAPRMEYPF